MQEKGWPVYLDLLGRLLYKLINSHPHLSSDGCTGRSKFRPRGGVKTGHRGGHWLRTCATKIPYKTGL